MKTTTINKEEIDKFSKIAEEWWDPEGKFKPLHIFNPLRIKYIKNSIREKYIQKTLKIKYSQLNYINDISPVKNVKKRPIPHPTTLDR